MLYVLRATVRAHPRPERRLPVVGESLERPLQALIEQHPTFGYHRSWALLRGQELRVNRKAV